MEIIKIVITSLSSLIVLFILTKLMGNRQVSELTMFDYVIGISIGSIAAEMATDLEKPLYGVAAMAVYALAAILISFLTSKFYCVRKLFFGKSIVLMKNGKIIKSGLKKAHLDLSEFLMQSRTAGYFDISSVKTAFFEPNGKISFLPYPDKRPITANDIEFKLSGEELFTNVISDGVIIEKNLISMGFDKIWLKKEMEKQNAKNEKDVFLATLNKDGKLNIFRYQ